MDIVSPGVIIDTTTIDPEHAHVSYSIPSPEYQGVCVVAGLSVNYNILLHIRKAKSSNLGPGTSYDEVYDA
jgi:hypothetical protein